MRRPEAEVAIVAVLHAQELLAVVLPAAALLPQLRGTDRGQQHLLRAGALHLLANDALDLTEHAHAERQEVVDPTRDLTDHSGAQHQLVAHDLGLGGHLTQRRNQKSSLAHGSPSDNRRDAAAASALIARVATIAPIAGAQRRTADRRARGARPIHTARGALRPHRLPL